MYRGGVAPTTSIDLLKADEFSISPSAPLQRPAHVCRSRVQGSQGSEEFESLSILFPLAVPLFSLVPIGFLPIPHAPWGPKPPNRKHAVRRAEGGHDHSKPLSKQPQPSQSSIHVSQLFLKSFLGPPDRGTFARGGASPLRPCPRQCECGHIVPYDCRAANLRTLWLHSFSNLQ